MFLILQNEVVKFKSQIKQKYYQTKMGTAAMTKFPVEHPARRTSLYALAGDANTQATFSNFLFFSRTCEKIDLDLAEKQRKNSGKIGI